MRNKAYDLNQWTFGENDRILPDTNFWLNNLSASSIGLQRRQPWVAAYSGALASMIQAGTALYFDVLVLSEFVNVLARNEFNTRFTQTYGGRGFKRFRNSPDFPPVARRIAGECRKILRLSRRLDHAFAEWDLPALLAGFETGSEDINDQLLVECARKHNLMLLTDDADMVRGGLRVLTANPRLLRACPA